MWRLSTSHLKSLSYCENAAVHQPPTTRCLVHAARLNPSHNCVHLRRGLVECTVRYQSEFLSHHENTAVDRTPITICLDHVATEISSCDACMSKDCKDMTSGKAMIGVSLSAMVIPEDHCTSKQMFRPCRTAKLFVECVHLHENAKTCKSSFVSD